ncbi:GNAT family N-acetyltransferase [Plantactinospora endophytica]|uniref:N-acetyltransferase domain-containing protein n=1 Tax=Plantactinospora endophytica TaxID=673535 RepID=A0ABQ4E0W5_9ACTN|nr:GNAT family N-acetyltransferase [Plantactinospora endophytica]GIG88316.1 hypothetical protein Pen02_32520 [Plantactinospora endophytica]
MTETMTVRRAGLADARAIAATVGRAGMDEAVFCWVVPDESARQACTEAWVEFAAGWVSGALEIGEILVVRDGSSQLGGLSVWEFRPAGPAEPATAADPTRPATGHPTQSTTAEPTQSDTAGSTQPATAAPTRSATTDLGPDERQAAFLERAYGRYAPRMVLVSELIAARHPDRQPHWYLQQMAVLPGLRGRGLGGAMLHHQLVRADAEGVGTYLEASSPRNRALYERYGFRAHGEPIQLPDGGPALQPMWRDPQPDRAATEGRATHSGATET